MGTSIIKRIYFRSEYSSLVPTLPYSIKRELSYFWRCMYRASYFNVYINQRDAQFLLNNLYFFVNRLYIFWTIISPSSGATFNQLYSSIGTLVPVLLAAVQQPDLPACTALYSLLNVAPDDGLMIVQNM